MLQFAAFIVLLCITAITILYGLYCFLLPRWRARLSLWRLLYRIVMAVRRKPAKPISRFRIVWMRSVGALCLVIGITWLVQLHPQFRTLQTPLYTPTEHRWQAQATDGTPEETAVLEHLDRATRKRLDSDLLVGLFIAVADGDKTYTLGAGRKTLSQAAPPGMDTEFEIGSITKVFTSTALAALLETGTVKLDDPVSGLLPADWTLPASEGRAITLEDLATHHSALPRMPDDPPKGALMDMLLFNTLDDPYRNATTEYVRDYLAQLKLARLPGSTYEYSNLGAGVLGHALATKAGQSYAALVKSAVCDPLGMGDTAVSLNEEQTARLAQGYMGSITLGKLCIALPMTRWTMREPFQGCGSLCSTPRDMLKFLRANMAAPEGPLGKALERVQESRRPTDTPERTIGLAMHIQPVNGLDEPMYWHNGGTGGYNSFMGFTKKHKTGVLMLANGPLQEELATELLKALHEKDAAADHKTGG
jgi:CubicO group peptidase (beta-lactamase class C family)